MSVNIDTYSMWKVNVITMFVSKVNSMKRVFFSSILCCCSYSTALNFRLMFGIVKYIHPWKCINQLSRFVKSHLNDWWKLTTNVICYRFINGNGNIMHYLYALLFTSKMCKTKRRSCVISTTSENQQYTQLSRITVTHWHWNVYLILDENRLKCFKSI